jgi:hypothetical protein
MKISQTMLDDYWTYVAPATTNSTTLALVKPDKIAMKLVVVVMTTSSLAVRLLME